MEELSPLVGVVLIDPCLCHSVLCLVNIFVLLISLLAVRTRGLLLLLGSIWLARCGTIDQLQDEGTTGDDTGTTR